jgi:hypothetical protein
MIDLIQMIFWFGVVFLFVVIFLSHRSKTKEKTVIVSSQEQLRNWKIKVTENE